MQRDFFLQFSLFEEWYKSLFSYVFSFELCFINELINQIKICSTSIFEIWNIRTRKKKMQKSCDLNWESRSCLGNIL